MSKLIILLVIAALFTLGNGPMAPAANEVVLDASQVTSAPDIEQAIETATANGTRPGIVTLDSSMGKFEYTGDDRSINIYYSNITLRSLNGATIGNCADGVFFDEVTANNIIIEGIRFVCPEGHAVIAPTLAQHHYGILRNNYFETGPNPAVVLLQGDHWLITGNEILSFGTGISLNETGATIIRYNRIKANVGVELFNSGYDNMVTKNRISTSWQGVVLSGKTLRNKVTGNRIVGIQDSGIIFTDIVAWNRVIGNRIACEPGFNCAAVTADPLNYEQNKIAGNRIVKSK